MPAKTPISSQYGSPSSQKANDSSVATMTTSTNCPRTKAPSFMSIRTQVSRVTRRCLRGTSDCTSAIVAVALEDPVGADREHEQDPDEDLEQRLRHRDRGVEEARARRELPQPLVDRAQDLVPDPVRVDGGVVELRLRGRHRADRVVDLRDRDRHDEVEEEPDRGEEAEVVEDDADAARHARPAVEPLDARPHRRGDHEAEEEQRDDDPDLPERECEDDDRDGDERRRRRFACGSSHLSRDSLSQPERSERGYAADRDAPARDRARAAVPARARSRARRRGLLLCPVDGRCGRGGRAARARRADRRGRRSRAGTARTSS